MKQTAPQTPPAALRHTLSVLVSTLAVATFTALCQAPAHAQVAGSGTVPGTTTTTTADGVVLLNQDRALTGLGNGDAAGFPIHLTRSGTYRLTSNLVVPAGVDGIQAADVLNVVIDLNGFQIVGGAVCNVQVRCGDDEGTAGIRVVGNAGFVTVRNGRVRGFSFAGVGGSTMFSGRMSLQDMVLEQNGYGARGGQLIAHRVVVQDNGATGVAASLVTITDSHAVANAGSGFAGVRGTVQGSSASKNLDWGFTGTGLLLLGNLAHANNRGATYGGIFLPGTNAF